MGGGGADNTMATEVRGLTNKWMQIKLEGQSLVLKSKVQWAWPGSKQMDFGWCLGCCQVTEDGLGNMLCCLVFD
jgi:hypothetical protein